MIASGYTLDLYCDATDCKAGSYGLQLAQDSYSDEAKRVCWADARNAGWRLDAKRGRAICPKCGKRGMR